MLTRARQGCKAVVVLLTPQNTRGLHGTHALAKARVGHCAPEGTDLIVAVLRGRQAGAPAGQQRLARRRTSARTQAGRPPHPAASQHAPPGGRLCGELCESAKISGEANDSRSVLPWYSAPPLLAATRRAPLAPVLALSCLTEPVSLHGVLSHANKATRNMLSAHCEGTVRTSRADDHTTEGYRPSPQQRILWRLHAGSRQQVMTS